MISDEFSIGHDDALFSFFTLLLHTNTHDWHYMIIVLNID